MSNAFEAEGGSVGGAAEADTGTIAWLLPELVRAFDAATAALRQFRAGAAGVDRADVDLAPLRVARSHLHQAHGALELGELAGVTRLTEAIEEFLGLFEDDPARCDATALDAIIGGCRAIVEYLEDMQAGGRQQPLYLFPSYRELLAARGADRIHPADLFIADLGIRPPRDDGGIALGREQLTEQRSLFERALLRYIRNEDDVAALADLSRAVNAIDASVGATATPAQSQQRAFWWATRALFEALANDGFAKTKSNHGHLKRLAGRVNLQIRKLVEGSGAVAERLFTDALFFVAIAEPVTPHVREVQKRYHLIGAVPADFDTQRYGRIDANSLKTARDGISAAKTSWSAIVAGDVGQIHEFAKQTTAVLEAVGAVRRVGLAQVAKVIDGIATDLGFDPRQPKPAVGLDVATALLFLEGALERARSLDDAFDQRAALVVARVEASALGREHQAKPVDWLDRMSREAEERLTVATFVAELQANLRSAEKELDAFFRDPTARAGLAEAQKALAQVSGALALLGHDDVHRAIDRVRETVTRFQTDDEASDTEAFEELAQSLGAVGFYVEQIKRDRIDRDAFHYDPATGRFSATMSRPAKEAAAAEPLEPAPLTLVGSGAQPEDFSYSDIAFAATQVLDSAETLEDEIAHRAADAAEHATRLRADPDDRGARDQLAAAIDDVRRNAALIDDRSLQDEAASVLASLRRAGHEPLGASSVAEIADSVVALVAQAKRSVGIAPPSAAPVEPTVAVPSEDNHAAIDAELLEIFLEEASEVLVDAQASLRVLDADPINATAAVNLRRGFHTLKGSSRMVGLAAFGDAGWAIEDTLNAHIADQTAASNDLRALIDYAIRYLTGWVDELRSDGHSSRVPDALIEGARAVRAGGPPNVLAFAATEIIGDTPDPEHVRDTEEDFAKTMFMPSATPVVDDPMFATTEVMGDEPVPDLSFLDSQSEVQAIDASTPSHDEHLTEPSLPTSEPETAEARGHEEAPTLDWLDFPVDGEVAAAHEEPANEPHVEPVEAPAADNVVLFTPRAPATAGGDDVRQIGPLTLSVALFNIYLSESDELLRVLTQDFSEWRHELDRFVSEGAMRAAHSLAGSSATVGLVPAHDLAAGIEEVLQALYREPLVLAGEQVECLQEAVESLRRMLHRFAAERMPEPDPVGVAALIALKRSIARQEGADAHLPTEPVDVSTSTDEATPAESVADSIFASYAFEDTGPEVGVPVDEADATVPSEARDDLDEIAEAEAVLPVGGVELPEASNDFDSITTIGASEMPVEVAEPIVVELLDDSSLVALDPNAHDEAPHVDVSAPAEEHVVEAAYEPLDEIASEHTEPVHVDASAPGSESVAEEVHEGVHEEVHQDWHEHVATEAFEPAPVSEAEAFATARRAAPSEREVAIRDDIDPDLLDVFVEEGNDILPQIGTLLRTWQAHRDNPAPSRTLLRHLHTLKGSARMAGAMRLGEVVHDIEARVEAAARLHEVPGALIDELLAAHDRSLELFDRVQNPEPAAAEPAPIAEAPTALAAVDVAPETPAIEAAAEASTAPATAEATGRGPKHGQHVVRVASETLDRLVNLAGEVSISRARIENELLQIKAAMGDLSDNVERLRTQLREIELQAEFQMQSRMQSQHTSGEERKKFDPLEFDRFTRFQELTRMMAESVNDVKTVQHNLQKSLDVAETDLASQRRMTRDLQQDLMQVRMVPFSSVAERLYRVARRAAKEVDKRVNLDIRGGSVEIDRSVLERMAGPFEHLLRNHIVHGIESRDARRAAGKDETGELLVEVRQEGNEIVLTFSDDGAGLDYARIREKARDAGLITGDIGDAKAAELIFHPGFSTVSEVTELAGRGVGLDVVRTEATELAGRVSVDSEAGKGTRFTINLPLTLAVTQVVLVSVAQRIYALPAVLVEKVQQFRPQPLADAYRAGELDWSGAKVRLAFLGTLLGIEESVPVAQRGSPVLILRSAAERIAIHVDEVIGNQEVVVKNLGPQLSRMSGIAGATVLGSGEIVLILNPVQLGQAIRAERARDAVVALAAADEPAPVAPASTQGTDLQTLPTVMVVDDSLTVRRVTQRLLSREGYQVVLAKDGVDALEQLQDYPPDAMLVDIEMPRMDGFDLTRNVRSDERFRHIPIIMITSRTAEKHRRHAAELGVDAYLGKPYQEDELLDLLALHVKARRGHAA